MIFRPRPLATLLVVAIGVVAAACGSGAASSSSAHAPRGTSTAVHTPVSPPYAHITPVVRTPTPIYTPVSPDVLESAIRDCLAGASTVDQAARAVPGCAAARAIGVQTLPVDGVMPALFIEQFGRSSCRSDGFVAWQQNGAWQLQSLPRPFADFELVLNTTPGGTLRQYAPTDVAREASGEFGIRIAVIVGINSCGSGPSSVPVMLAFAGGVWSWVWIPIRTTMLDLADTSASFVGTGIDTVNVRGFAWNIDLPGQPAGAGDVFYESHPGLHRKVDQTWTMADDGSGYTFAGQTVEPSAYGTLLNFIADISTGDDRGAAVLTTDPALVSAARALGLEQHPIGQQWGAGYSPPPTGRITVGGRTAYMKGPPLPVIVTFVQRGGAWLIASLSAGPPEPTPTLAPPSPPRAG